MHPPTRSKKIFSFFRELFLLIFSLEGERLDSREYFIMWRTTEDVEWRDRGYEIVQAIEKHARTRFGYLTVFGIDGPAQQLDDIPKYVIYLLPSFLLWVTCLYSWFLAETLKYLYFLFDDINSFKLDEWVFDTETRPLFQHGVEREFFVEDKPDSIVRS